MVAFSSQNNNTIKNATQQIVRPTPKVPNYTEHLKVYDYVTNKVEIILGIHFGKNATVYKDLNESGRELSLPLTCDL